jgi:hypothetical protein
LQLSFELAAFTSILKTMKNIFKRSFAVITGTVEARGPHNGAANVSLTTALADYLRKAGYAFDACVGYYKGIDQGRSFFVHNIQPRDARAIGRIFHQESVITHRGLEFCNGDPMLPVKSVLFGPAAMACDNYTAIAFGPVFSYVL